MSRSCTWILALVLSATSCTMASDQTVADDSHVKVLIGPSKPDPGRDVQPGPLNAPFAVEFDSMNRMWIVEYDGGRVLRCDADRLDSPLVIAGPDSATASDATANDATANDAIGYVDGPAKQARFNKLHNLAIDDNDVIYLSDHENHAVRRLLETADGQWMVESFSGNGKPGQAKPTVDRETATYNQPISVTLDPAKRRLLVADIKNRVVRAINLANTDLAKNEVTIIAGKSNPLRDPRAVDVADDGALIILERNGNRLRRLDANGTLTTLAGDGTKGKRDGDALQANFNGPKHLDIGPDGRIYIADDNNHLIRIFDPSSKQVSTLDTGDFRLNRPHGVLVRDGKLYIADSFHHRILRVPVPPRSKPPKTPSQ